MATKAATAEKPQLESWDDVDRLLSRLGKIEPKKTERDAQLASSIQLIKDGDGSIQVVEHKGGSLVIIRHEKGDEVKQLAAEIEAAQQALTEFVIDHSKELSGEDGRTRVLTHGTISLRTNKPSLGKLAKVSWERVLDVALTFPKKIRERIVRTKDSLAKDELIDMLSKDQLTDEQRKALGIRLEQTESIYYELKAETA